MEYSEEERAIIGLCMTADESRLSVLARAFSELFDPLSGEKICVSMIEKAAKRVYKDEPLPSEAEQDAAIARLEALNMFAVTLVSNAVYIGLLVFVLTKMFQSEKCMFNA